MQTRALLAMTLTLASCDDASKPTPAKDSPPATVSSKEAPAKTACNVAKLDALADSIRKERATWTPALGRPVSRAQEVVSGLEDACEPVVLAPFEGYLDRFEEREDSVFPIYANSRTGPSLRVCPTIDVVSRKVLEAQGDERPGHIFQGCDLSRFSTIITRDEFVGVQANTGAVPLIGLSLSLQDAGIAKPSSEVLARELVLASGLFRLLPEAMKLPAADGGEQLAHGYSVLLSPKGLSVGGTTGARQHLEVPAVLFDLVSEENDRWQQIARKHPDSGTSMAVLLFVDRQTAWTELASVAATVKRAAPTSVPRLVVLGDAEGNPFRSIPLPEVKDPGSRTVQDVLKPAP